MAAFIKRQHSMTRSSYLDLTLLNPGLKTRLRICGRAVQDLSALEREPRAMPGADDAEILTFPFYERAAEVRTGLGNGVYSLPPA